jgi:hypothetical protein
MITKPILIEDKKIIKAIGDLGLEEILPEDVGYNNPRVKPVYDVMLNLMRERNYIDKDNKALVKCKYERKLTKNEQGEYKFQFIVKINT